MRKALITTVIAVSAGTLALTTNSQARNTPNAPSMRAAVALDDPTIVAIFDEANTADIETGALGAKKGSTKAIRDFGAMLVRDHKAVRTKGRNLAKKLGVTPTPLKDDQELGTMLRQ